MEIPLTLKVILLGLIISQGFFASFLFFIRKVNPTSNKYLGFLLLSYSFWMIDDFLNAANIYQQNPNFYFLPIYFSFAFGPLIYLYTKSLTEERFGFSKKDLWHFVPVMIQLSLYLYLQYNNYTFRRWFWQDIHLPYTYNIEYIGSLLSLFIYLLMSIKLVSKYQNWIQNQFSEISKINLNWLKIVQYLTTVLCILWLIDSGLRVIWQYYPNHDFSAITIGISILILAVGALNQPSIEIAKINKRADLSIVKNPIDFEQSILDHIINEMNSQRFYLDPQLTLQILAQKINLPSRKVSQHINHGLNKSFIDFVNEYRVEAWKNLIKAKESNHLTLAGIAYEVGFNSKATFNRVFKKISGMSPSSYQKKSQNKN